MSHVRDEVTLIPEGYLEHIGVIRRSGRYPWGSGDNPYQRHSSFYNEVREMKKQGMSEAEIARGLGMSTTQLRAKMSIEKAEQRRADAAYAFKLKEKGLSNVAIGERMGINESSVRALLDPKLQMKADSIQVTADILKDNLAKNKYLDVGAGVELDLGVSATKLNTAIKALEEEGYTVHTIPVTQIGTGKETRVKVLAPPGTTWGEVMNNQTEIGYVSDHSDDGGLTFRSVEPPKSISSKRVDIRYAEDGGAEADGLMYIRPGVEDVSLGGARYAQVRVAVDGTHYLKGMAIYKDDLPPGVDIQFNTNKSDTGNKLDALKRMQTLPDGSIDIENPFGASIKPNGQRGVMNIVNEEGDWYQWSRKLSSQMLSKQPASLAKQQLDISYKLKKDEYDEIMSLTNPAVKRKLLEGLADSADSSAVHLKAASLPRTRSHVLIPIKEMADNEIYAPQYRNGEKVVLIRHPHGGTFEIPELTVNNRQPAAKKILGAAMDAVGINSRVAQRLSGADFDGDSVLVIPNNDRRVKTSPPLQGLKDFDPQVYKLPDDAPRMSPRTKQQKMGEVSNLITDMTIRGASHAEIARAVRHSMVVIDAEKHHLDYKQSAKDNGIRELERKYQTKTLPNGKERSGGASTLISRAGSKEYVPETKPRPASQGGPIDPATGKRVFVPTGRMVTNKKGETVVKQVKVKRLERAEDAHTLSSGRPIESVYADYSNRMKALANQARKSQLETKSTPYSPSAKQTYASEVASLNAKLNVALKNAPRERKAQLLANAQVKLKRQAKPDMEESTLKKVKRQALEEARVRTQAKKVRVDITPSEWNAIQAGAISNHKLEQILNNADLDKIKTLATPRQATVATSAVMARAKTMLAGGYTQAEIASALGISASTLSDALLREES